MTVVKCDKQDKSNLPFGHTLTWKGKSDHLQIASPCLWITVTSDNSCKLGASELQQLITVNIYITAGPFKFRRNSQCKDMPFNHPILLHKSPGSPAQ